MPGRRVIVGVDEAGRGPLAGPVAVGVCAVLRSRLPRLRRLFYGVRDSKELTPLGRMFWFKSIREAASAGQLSYAVSLVGERTIDRRGIAVAIRLGIRRALRRLPVTAGSCRVLLDGGLSAPEEFSQKTIIGGDKTELPIMLASLVAKARRDARMVRLAKRYPSYAFELHKGYGTRLHYRRIRRHGLSPIHRRSFLRAL